MTEMQFRSILCDAMNQEYRWVPEPEELEYDYTFSPEFEKKMQKSKLRSRADFIMALVRDKPIIVPEGFRELAVELKREGNNFNQCLRFMHSTQTGIPEWTIKTAANNMNSLYKKIADMLDGLNMVNENANL